MMPDIEKLANSLFGGKRAETDSAFTLSDTHTMIGTATTDSDSGAVMVELSSDVTNPEPVEIDGVEYFADADTAVELPTTQDVQAGDEVLVSVFGGNALRSGVVTGVVGSGDRVAGMAQDAYDLADSVEGIAQQALDVANATGQHFWSDTDGAHVTEVTQEEWTDPTDPGYQSGPNSLWNSLGMLFRNGLNNLLALIPGRSTTDSFTIETSIGTKVCELSSRAVRVSSVKVNGAEVSNWELLSPDSVFVRGPYNAAVEIAYIPEPSMQLSDGVGNLAENIIALFSASLVNLAGGFFSLDANAISETERTGSIKIGADGPRSAELLLTTNEQADYAQVMLAAYSENGYNAAIYLDTIDGALDLNYLQNLRMRSGTSYPITTVETALQKAIRLGATYSASTNVSITANTDIMGASVNVPAGTYLVICWQTFRNPGSSGQRTTTVGTYSGGSLASYTTAVQATRDQVRVQHMDIVTTTGSSTTLQAYARSNIAASGNNNSQINAVCIG